MNLSTYVNVTAARKAQAGDTSELFNAFAWGTTPQGPKYWLDIFTGAAPLDADAKANIEDLIQNHENAVASAAREEGYANTRD